MEKPKGLHDPKEKLFIWKGGVICCLHWLKSPVVPGQLRRQAWP